MMTALRIAGPWSAPPGPRLRRALALPREDVAVGFHKGCAEVRFALIPDTTKLTHAIFEGKEVLSACLATAEHNNLVTHPGGRHHPQSSATAPFYGRTDGIIRLQSLCCIMWSID
jgi:hypothetical protein